MQNEFAGLTALVTGASRGIGAATAIALARAGCARVIIHYASSREGAEQTAAAVRSAGAETRIIGAQFDNEPDIQAFIAELGEDIGKIDILVNNAGSLVERAPLSAMTYELYNRVMDLNAKSVWFLTAAIAPAMIARGRGVVVNLSSIAARTGGGLGATVYAASKAAVAAMTKGMAKELAPAGVRVNAISPGTVDNNFHVQFSSRTALDSVVKTTPQGRLSTNEDMADVVVFLCSNAARNVIGQTIEVNGGAYMI
jgi:3-oxoacyl-[acyl-carrier protein] reductase